MLPTRSRVLVARGTVASHLCSRGGAPSRSYQSRPSPGWGWVVFAKSPYPWLDLAIVAGWGRSRVSVGIMVCFLQYAKSMKTGGGVGVWDLDARAAALEGEATRLAVRRATLQQ